jgi:hypothetical protein
MMLVISSQRPHLENYWDSVTAMVHSHLELISVTAKSGKRNGCPESCDCFENRTVIAMHYTHFSLLKASFISNNNTSQFLSSPLVFKFNEAGTIKHLGPNMLPVP